jgi:hypothetical protein
MSREAFWIAASACGLLAMTEERPELVIARGATTKQSRKADEKDA